MLFRMADSSPLRNAFRVLWQRPILAVGEIVWRWTFAAAASILVSLAARQVLQRVDFSPAEIAVADRNQVYLVVGIVARSLSLLAKEALTVGPALLLLWIILASLGRGLTVAALLHALGRDGTATQESGTPALASPLLRSARARVRSGLLPLAAVHILRMFLTFAAVAASVGAVLFISGLLPRGSDGNIALPSILFWLLLQFSILLGWIGLNWFLSLSPIFVLRDRRSALGAVSDSLSLFSSHPRGFIHIATWFGLLRACLLVLALVFAIIAASAAGHSITMAIVLTIFIALAYSLVHAWLGTLRLAAYISLIDESVPREH
jgi:hypothetical protein